MPCGRRLTILPGKVMLIGQVRQFGMNREASVPWKKGANVNKSYRSVWTVLVLGLLSMAGCGPERTVDFHYFRQASYEISPQIKRIAVAQFTTNGNATEALGDVASDRTASALDRENQKYNRYQIVDRKRLKQIMDERDLRIAISDPAAATKVGKLADVDGMIYGSVTASVRDEHLTREVIDPLRQGMKTVSYVRRYCLVTIHFTFDNINTGTSMASVTCKREYDSDKEGKGGIGKAFGMGGDKAQPADAVMDRLVDQCVTEFIAKVIPHDEQVSEKLASGGGLERGNKMAAEKEYKDALEIYLAAIERDRKDGGAYFNAGLMYEALGDFQNAEKMYGKAYSLKDDQRYLAARKRVRVEGAAAPAPTPTPAPAPAATE